MSLVEKVKSLVRDEGKETYRYECESCKTEFASSAPNPNDVDCPRCGSGRVHTAV